ncbi:MAG: hypothetical protein E7262_09770 [Lachnospiraceae bacterium]|nr:hypothetical protein [Lachnospiraceae bacterium]
MLMNMKVSFFEDKFVEAIRAGIYEIYIQKDDKEELLYVGESVFVLVRCATHLYEIVKGEGYLGFDKELLEKDNIMLKFKLAYSIGDKKERKDKEIELIKEKKPKMQSGIGDRVKSIEDMINELKNLLNNE